MGVVVELRPPSYRATSAPGERFLIKSVAIPINGGRSSATPYSLQPKAHFLSNLKHNLVRTCAKLCFFEHRLLFLGQAAAH